MSYCKSMAELTFIDYIKAFAVETRTDDMPSGSAKRDIYTKPTASREAAQLWGL